MGKNKPDFIVIDDDRINNMLCTMVIKRAVPGASVSTFIYPDDGLAYIDSVCSATAANDIVLFLDINMPVLNGWEVLEELRNMGKLREKQFAIFMLSSSIASKDRERATANEMVSGFLAKPLKVSDVEATILQQVN